ncbi:MAG: hypothetical protein R2877_02935 [Bdellovibrionota bacterium]
MKRCFDRLLTLRRQCIQRLWVLEIGAALNGYALGIQIKRSAEFTVACVSVQLPDALELLAVERKLLLGFLGS